MTNIRLGGVLAALIAAPAFAQVDPIRAVLTEAVKEVSSARIEATVRRLCDFGTRHPLSRTDSDTEGTGAARKWLKAAYEEIAKTSGGRLTVALQTAKVPCTRPGMPREVEVVWLLPASPCRLVDEPLRPVEDLQPHECLREVNAPAHCLLSVASRCPATRRAPA